MFCAPGGETAQNRNKVYNISVCSQSAFPEALGSRSVTESTHTERFAREPEAAVRSGSRMRRGLGGHRFDICVRRLREGEALTGPGGRDRQSRVAPRRACIH